MKCPNCAAEVHGKFCDFCGSEMPQEKETANTINNYYYATSQEKSESEDGAAICPQCGKTKITFKRERVGTVTQASSRKKYVGSGRKGQSVSQTAYRTVGVCQNCGYTWCPDASANNMKPQRKTWLWVLGWICIFPVPLTILLLRKKDMKPAVKYGIIAAAWVLYLIIGIAGNAGESTTTVEEPTSTAIVFDENAVDAGAKENADAAESEKISEVSTASAEEVTLMQYVGQPVAALVEKVEELGYTATYLADGVDFTEFLDSLIDDYLTQDIEINVEKKEIIVHILFAEKLVWVEQESKLRENLEIGSAWIAVKNYGENIYGSDFELHYILGKIAESMEDENTWFLKANCTVFGVDMVCEAKVTGTTENPQVIDFYVY